MSPSAQAQQSEKDMLIAQIQRYCRDDIDYFTQLEWTEFTIPKLKTVVLLLNDEVVSLLDANDDRKYHCFALENLYNYMKYMESRRQTPSNYVTRQGLTLRQKAMIEYLYFRALRDAAVYEQYRPSDEEFHYVHAMRQKYSTRRNAGQHRTAGLPVGALDPLVMERQRLLGVLQRVCRGATDPLTHKAWNTLTLSELRHVQIMPRIQPEIRTPRSRDISQYRARNRPCFLVQSLYRAIKRSDTDTLNALVGRPLTERQKRAIIHYYKFYLTEKMVWSKSKPSLTAQERTEFRELEISKFGYMFFTSVGDDVFYEHSPVDDPR